MGAQARQLGEGGYPDVGVRLGWLDVLKAASALAVVMTHVASIGWQAMEPAADGWLITSVYEIVTRFAVPAFFMTTGALLLNPGRHVSIRRLALGYAAKTALCALAVSFLYCTLERVLGGWEGWRSVVRGSLDGPYFIWYLWVLVGLYALTPMLRPLTRDRRLLSYSLVVLSFFVMGKSTVCAMFPGSWLALWFDNFILFGSGMEGVFYYLLGAWLVSWRPARRQSATVMLAGTACVVVAIACNYASALSVGPDLYYVARDNVLIAGYSVAVFELFRLAGTRMTDVGADVARWFADRGLGVYLIHPFFRLLMEQLGCFSGVVAWLLEFPLLAIPVVSVVLWGLSLIVAQGLRLIWSLLRSACSEGRKRGGSR